jgi:hypothetical protein
MVFSMVFPTPKCKKLQGKAMIFRHADCSPPSVGSSHSRGTRMDEGRRLSVLVIVDTCFFKTNTDYTDNYDNKYISYIIYIYNFYDHGDTKR